MVLERRTPFNRQTVLVSVPGPDKTGAGTVANPGGRFSMILATSFRALTRASVFGPCPLFLVFVLLTLLGAELEAAIAGLTSPHQGVSIPILWLAVMILVVPFAWAAQPTGGREWIEVVAAGMILPFGNLIMPWASAQTIWLLPQVYDRWVIDLDGTLGVQPSFVIATLFNRFPTVATICWYSYAL